MKKTLSALTALMFVISVSGCAESGTQSGAGYKPPESMPTTTTAAATASDDAEKIPISEKEETPTEKTKLVWAIQDQGMEKADIHTDKVNEYLNSLGCDYEVEFRIITPERAEEFPPVITKDYSEFIREDVNGAGEIDIFYMPLPSENRYEYTDYAKEGLLEPLDEYLASDTGLSLYELMPENHWSGLTVNGKIYGIDGGMHTLADNAGYWYSTELLEKYPEYDITLPPSEQLEMLRIIQESEGQQPFSLRSNLLSPAYYVNGACISQAVYYDDESRSFRSVLDDENYLSTLNEYFKLSANGLLSGNQSGDEFARVFLAEGGCADKPFTAFNGNENITPVFGGTKRIRTTQTATGVSSASANKEKAFELLALTQTDAYLNNLLTFGVEGEDYELTNGRPDRVISHGNFYRFYCRMTGYPYIDRSVVWDIDTLETPEEIAEAYSQAIISDILDTDIDISGVSQQISDTDKVITEKLDMGYAGNYDTFESWIGEIEYSLNEAGIEDILSVLNSNTAENTQ